MSIREHLLFTAAALLFTSAASAQEREPGFEFGVDLIYQDSQSASFEGGSSVETDSDLGVSLVFGYRVNSHLDVQLAIDWQDIDYKAQLVTQGSLNTIRVDNSLEVFTPRAIVNYNILEGPFTPYVTGGVGWAFVDTNIPNGLPQDYCWFDPWWGPVCVRDQPTASFDELVYDAGIGVRFDFGASSSMRLAYERHWVDYDNARSTPEYDQIKLGFVLRY
jgi:opacity protein-like surface antigen